MAMKERNAVSSSGWLAIILGLAILASVPYVGSFARFHQDQPAPYVFGSVALFVLAVLILRGCFVVGPNEARVLTLFGRYAGSVRTSGLRWANPFAIKRSISLRARNFESAKIKVNDVEGNPIEIGAVVVWRVVDTAQAMFDVESYQSYVQIQAETAMRDLAMHHPYDSHDDKVVSLRGQSDHVAEQLRIAIAKRVGPAGVEIIDARIAHLAYSPEIAQAMLQRQQAGAIIAARQRIVEGAVSMVEMALAQLAEKGIVDLDAERKAHMVSNLLVVLCGERATQPVINTGTLH